MDINPNSHCIRQVGVLRLLSDGEFWAVTYENTPIKITSEENEAWVCFDWCRLYYTKY